MNINAAFPSAYLKAADLNGQRVTVTMSHVKEEKIGEDKRPVLYFQGKEKGIVLNKTNANSIASAYGFDTEDWTGQRIEIFPMDVEFQGKMVEAIRVKPARAAARQQYAEPADDAPQQRSAPPSHITQPAKKKAPVDLDDSIPF
jgi:hypothetical protein